MRLCFPAGSLYVVTVCGPSALSFGVGRRRIVTVGSGIGRRVGWVKMSRSPERPDVCPPLMKELQTLGDAYEKDSDSPRRAARRGGCGGRCPAGRHLRAENGGPTPP